MTGPIALRRPRVWADELAAALATELAARTESRPLPLSYWPDALEKWRREDGISQAEMESDFSAGCMITRMSRADGAYYRLRGTHYVAFVNPRESLSGVMTAIVNRVHRVGPELGRRDGLLPYRATFHEVFEDVACDIGEAYREASAHLAAVRQTAEGALGRRLVADSGNAQAMLRGEVRTHYATLQLMFTLLRQRSEIDGGGRACGAVAAAPAADQVAAGPPMLRIQTDPGQMSGRFPDTGTVIVSVPTTEQHWKLELVHILEEEIAVEAPRETIPPGTAVVVEYQPRFSLGRQQRALRAFEAEQVEGDWEALATLLIAPSTLPTLPRRLAPDQFHNAALNEEQRAAVAGAVSARHAFFIQGPPGTGKTTVVCEIVRQLVDRGQRVLLLAPMHVAVDEVLRRAGDQPGISALRLTWNDSKVAKDLVRFTKDNVAGEFVRLARQPSTSRAAIWQARIHELTADQSILDRCVTDRQAWRAAKAAAAVSRDEETTAAAAVRVAADESDQAAVQLAEAEALLADARQRVLVTAGDLSDAQIEVARAERCAQDANEIAREADRSARSATSHAHAAQAESDSAQASAAKALASPGLAAAELRVWQERSQVALETATRQVAQRRVEATDAQARHVATQRHAERAGQMLGQAERSRTWRSRVAGAAGLGELGSARRTCREAAAALATAEASVRIWQQATVEAIAGQAHVRQNIEDGARLRQDALAQAQSDAEAARAGEGWRIGLAVAAREVGEAAEAPTALAAVLAAAATAADSALGVAASRKAYAESAAADAASAAQSCRTTAEDWRATADRAQVKVRTTAARLSDANARATQARLAAAQREEAARLAESRVARLLSRDPVEAPDEDLREGSARRAAVADRYERYIRLERRWFELTGLDTDQSTGQRLRDLGAIVQGAANLVCGTTTGFGGQGVARDADFDTVIIDEASRVVDSEFLIGAVRARRWILVGDEHQLPPYVDPLDEHHLHALAALQMASSSAASVDYSSLPALAAASDSTGSGSAGDPELAAAVEQLGNLWTEDEELHRFRSASVLSTAERIRSAGVWAATYARTFGLAHEQLRAQGADPERKLLRAMREHMVQSLFERCVAGAPVQARQRLTEQRRMIAPIAEIVREPVYHGQYRSASAEELAVHGVTPLVGQLLTAPVVFCDTSTQPHPEDEPADRTGFVNQLEAAWVERLCRIWERELRARGEGPVTVSVLTFYRAQAKVIRQRLGYPSFPGFRALRFGVVDAIDSIQGQESDLVILSFCRARRGRPGDGFGMWLQDVRRLNVACTRARRGLTLVGHRDTLEQLRGIEAAGDFYRNLFALFDDGRPGTLLLKELQ